MYYVHIIKSRIKKYFHTGSTKDLKKRFIEHNQGKTNSIKHLIPFELIYYEAYSNKTLARKREIELKNNNSFKKKELFDRIK